MKNTKSYRLLAKLVLAAIFMPSTSHAGIIFQDEFSVSPLDNGWTPIIDATSSAVGVISLAPSGNQMTLDKTSGSGTVNFSITRTVATNGFEDITLNLTAFQSSTGFESSDFLEVEYNPGAGFVSLLRDVEVWNGQIDLIGEAASGTDGQTSAVSTGELVLPADAANNSLLQVRINASVNANAEDYFLDHISVSGTATAIPEASPLLCFGLLASLVLGKQFLRRLTCWHQISRRLDSFA